MEQKSGYYDKPYNPSLSLQILLFLNVYCAPMWFIAAILSLYYEFDYLSTIHKTLSILSLLLITPIECLRLYLGYSGNLKDKIPDFAGFWILSTFLQFPMQLYLSISAPQIQKFLLAWCMEVITTALLALEIVIAFFAIKGRSKERAEQFHLQQLLKSRETRTAKESAKD
ncbi:transmembrane protein 17-like [Culicoides brevitarsis]|uniref:transmembrane protein 17-like n=1 Tax=Culicoides brevitarsis TaxID=469753 RepID=UPI00307BD8F6